MKTDEEYEELYQSRYKIELQLKKEILNSHEREERNKKARFDLMMDLNHSERRYNNLIEDFRKLLKASRAVDKL